MKRPIALPLSPNAEKDDVMLALKVLFGGEAEGDSVEELEKEFEEYFGGSFRAKAINSGRSAQYEILKGYGIGKGDEVIIQAFTCVSVPNSIIWLGARPVYVDIDDTLNISVSDLEKNITKRTKAIIVQHTFGTPADLDPIIIIAKKHGIKLIEDCAHSLGAKYKGKKVGTLGDASFFSFGRDKVISSVFGGMIITDDNSLFGIISRSIDSLSFPKKSWIRSQLIHPIAFSIILPLYSLYIGKLILFILQRMKILSKPIYKEESCSGQPNVFPQKLSPELAILARNQFKKLDRFNKIRKNIAKHYKENLRDTKSVESRTGSIFLRYSIFDEKSESLYKYSKNRGVLLGNWYKNVVMPACSLDVVGYEVGTCPQAEKFSRTIVNLPTYPTMTIADARNVIKIIKRWKNTV